MPRSEGILDSIAKNSVKQDEHVDYDAVYDFVYNNNRIEKEKLPQLPYSILLPLSKNGCDLYFSEYAKHIHVKYGDCLMWRGDVKHSGMGYRDFNIRFFAYLDTKEFPHDLAVYFLKDEAMDLKL
jgi:hypothetical protein